MNEREDENAARIDEALKRAQRQERDEAAEDVRKKADVDEGIVAAFTARDPGVQQTAAAPDRD